MELTKVNQIHGIIDLKIETTHMTTKIKSWILFGFQKKLQVFISFGSETAKTVKISKKPHCERFCFLLNEKNFYSELFVCTYSISSTSVKTLLNKKKLCIEIAKSSPMSPRKFCFLIQNFDTITEKIHIVISYIFIPIAEIRLIFWKINIKGILMEQGDSKTIQLKDLETLLNTFYKNEIVNKEKIFHNTNLILLTDIDSFLREKLSPGFHINCFSCLNELFFESYDLMIDHISLCSYLDVIKETRTPFSILEYMSIYSWSIKLLSFFGFREHESKKKPTKILVKDRKTGKLVEEKIPTTIRLSIWLMYKGTIGKKTSNTKLVLGILKKITLLNGKRFEAPSSIKKIPHFIKYYNINTDEIEKPIGSYKTFNEFFYRKLKKSARFVEDISQTAISSPADSRICCFLNINLAMSLWIKGKKFSIEGLLYNKKYNCFFSGGSIAVCRLAPQDYHRFHSPVNGIVVSIDQIPGKYITVNPIVVKQNINVFTENKRAVVYIQTKRYGLVALVAIGAVCVGSINITCKVGFYLNVLDEVGYFAFGGSTVILVFQNKMVLFDTDLIKNTTMNFETLVYVGNKIGTLQGAQNQNES